MTDDAAPDELGRLIEAAERGDREALSSVLPGLYGELRRLAGGYLRRERHARTLQATALVHEAYLRLLKDRNLTWQNRAHLTALIANAMRQILVEHARARAASKRGGGRLQVTLEEDLLRTGDRPVDLLALDEVLERLAQMDAQQARIVELRFFGGLTVDEIAQATGVSPATVKRRLEFAKAWLRRELTRV